MEHTIIKRKPAMQAAIFLFRPYFSVQTQSYPNIKNVYLNPYIHIHMRLQRAVSERKAIELEIINGHVMAPHISDLSRNYIIMTTIYIVIHCFPGSATKNKTLTQKVKGKTNSVHHKNIKYCNLQCKQLHSKRSIYFLQLCCVHKF